VHMNIVYGEGRGTALLKRQKKKWEAARKKGRPQEQKGSACGPEEKERRARSARKKKEKNIPFSPHERKYVVHPSAWLPPKKGTGPDDKREGTDVAKCAREKKSSVVEKKKLVPKSSPKLSTSKKERRKDRD